jgi:hypothetical protein
MTANSESFWVLCDVLFCRHYYIHDITAQHNVCFNQTGKGECHGLTEDLYEGGPILKIQVLVIYRCPRRNVPDFGRVFLMLK